MASPQMTVPMAFVTEALGQRAHKEKAVLTIENASVTLSDFERIFILEPRGTALQRQTDGTAVMI